MGLRATLRMQNDLDTPYFIIEEKELQKNIIDLQNALRNYWGRNYIIGYSFKTNSLPWLLNYFKKYNFYAEVVSDDEYQLAHELGYKKNKIVFNGPRKSRENFINAIRNKCIVNIDSQRELYWLKELEDLNGEKYEVGIRVNFDLERYCPNESAMGNEGGRFGFCYENGELKRAIDYINSLSHVRLVGLHLHFSTKTRSLNVYKAISKMACEIKKNYELDLKYIDIGGGFYGGLEDKPKFKGYMEVISRELDKVFDKEKMVLIVEPGTSLVSSPFSFVTSVIDVKKTTVNNFVVTDGSRINIDPLMNKSKYFYSIKYGDNSKRNVIKSQIISGFTCMENDRILKIENQPQLLIGDKIIYEKVGAYTIALSPLFISYFPDVYVKNNEEIYKVRKKWTAKEFLMKSELYSR